MVVAIVQGTLGGLIFWFLGIKAAVLWAVVMAFLSLLPAVGTGIDWLPVAVYLLATGLTWDGVILIAYGALVIGLVDNFLRPILVGKDTQMPDYVVLISTLGRDCGVRPQRLRDRAGHRGDVHCCLVCGGCVPPCC